MPKAQAYFLSVTLLFLSALGLAEDPTRNWAPVLPRRLRRKSFAMTSFCHHVALE